jgi:hypothetical protein
MRCRRISFNWAGRWFRDVAGEEVGDPPAPRHPPQDPTRLVYRVLRVVGNPLGSSELVALLRRLREGGPPDLDSFGGGTLGF